VNCPSGEGTRDVQIDLLADRPEFIPLLAEWHHREWAYLRPGFSMRDRVALMQERSCRHELPITIVASSGTKLLGSAMLIAHDMDTHPEYSPRLAGVFVSLTHRRRGIGRALSEHVVHEAARLGFATLYLTLRVLETSTLGLAGLFFGGPVIETPMSRSCHTP
jgi:GNAT superfamily N-acetyltransferase